MEEPLPPSRPYRGCSLRAILLGLVLSAFMGLAIPYGDMIKKWPGQELLWHIQGGADRGPQRRC